MGLLALKVGVMNIFRINMVVGILVFAVAVIFGGESRAATVSVDERVASSSTALLQLSKSMRGRMANSPFKIPLIIESVQTSENIKGDVYAEIKHPFATVSAALSVPQVWCDILILHLNTKSCALQPDVNNPDRKSVV